MTRDHEITETLQMGEKLMAGRGVPQNNSEAMHWFRFKIMNIHFDKFDFNSTSNEQGCNIMNFHFRKFDFNSNTEQGRSRPGSRARTVQSSCCSS